MNKVVASKHGSLEKTFYGQSFSLSPSITKKEQQSCSTPYLTTEGAGLRIITKHFLMQIDNVRFEHFNFGCQLGYASLSLSQFKLSQKYVTVHTAEGLAVT